MHSPAQSQTSTTLATRSGKHTDHTKQGVHQTRDASKLTPDELEGG